VAAWPGLRTLSVFRILYVLLCLGAAIWLLFNRKLPSNLHVHDENRVSEYGIRARARVEAEYGWDHITDLTDEVYRSLLS